MQYTTVFLDFDDTLIDTQAHAQKCLAGIYKDHEVNKYFPTFTDFATVYNKSTHQLWDQYAKGEIDKQTLLKERFKKPFGNFPDISQSYLDNMSADFVARAVHIDLCIEGAESLLKYLKAKYKIAMISNGFSELQYDKLKNVGFTEYFDEIVLSDLIGVNKPHPDIYTHALAKCGATKEKTIMIGDNLLADIEGAKNSGIDQIWFNPNGEQTDINPTHTVLRLEEIQNIL